jgi:myo-inositol-1(or 4)-monophosphatase
MKDIIKVGIEAATQAGDFLRANFGKVGSVVSKGDRNLVTNFDKEAEQLIVERIRRQFPDHGIIAEESGAQEASKEFVWIIDPLDGTHNYIRSIGLFGTSIGIVRRGEFVGGVVYMPMDDELYVGEAGNGAYKNGSRIEVSSRQDIKDCYLSFDSSIRYAADKMASALEALAKEVFNIRMFGSSARILTYIAEGKLDAAVEYYDLPWDFAGAVCIIREAKGKIAGLKGDPLVHTSTGYIASNGLLQGEIQRIIAPYV